MKLRTNEVPLQPPLCQPLAEASNRQVLLLTSRPLEERETALRPASTEMRGKSNLWTLILSAISMLLIAATVPTTGGAEPATGVTNREVTAPIDWANFAYSQCRPPK